jgi:hypothetical protein
MAVAIDAGWHVTEAVLPQLQERLNGWNGGA